MCVFVCVFMCMHTCVCVERGAWSGRVPRMRSKQGCKCVAVSNPGGQDGPGGHNVLMTV